MNSVRAIILFSLLFFATIEATAQDYDQFLKSISISFGAAHYRFIDEAFSHHRTQYNGTVFAMDLKYQKNKKKYLFDIDLQANNGGVYAALQKLDGKISYIQLSSSYAAHVKDYILKGMPSTLYIGGQVRSSNYILEDLDVLEEASGTFSQTLDLFLVQSMALSEKHSLKFAAAFPMAGFFKKTHYDGGANQDLKAAYQDNVFRVIFSGGKFTIINPFRIPQFNMVYVRNLTKRTDFSVRYQFSFLKNSSDGNINLFSNAFVAGLHFNFK